MSKLPNRVFSVRYRAVLAAYDTYARQDKTVVFNKQTSYHVPLSAATLALSFSLRRAEVAVPRMRGKLVTINALLCVVGQFSAGMVDGVFSQIGNEDGWRYMLGLAAVPSALMFAGFLTLPESPRWLVMAGKTRDALSVLSSVRDTDQVSG